MYNYKDKVKINEPFSGAIVPLKYQNDARVVSVMIELNRRIYDNDSFSKVQNINPLIYIHRYGCGAEMDLRRLDSSL